MIRIRLLVLLAIAAGCLMAFSQGVSAAPTTAPTKADSVTEHKKPSARAKARVKPTGESGRKLVEAQRESRKKTSSYKRWKRGLPFWWRKGFLLTELMVFISIGVLIGQILEASGIIRYLAVITWPVTRLGGLHSSAGPAFLMAFQSGAVANSMLVSYRDGGLLDRRQLYTSVFVVSCLSLFAHLPTFVLPIGSVFGLEATAALFGVRLVAIVMEIIVILLVSNLIVKRWANSDSGKTVVCNNEASATKVIEPKRKGPFWPTVGKRSWRTLRRLLLYVVPTFAFMAVLENSGFFRWLAATVPGLFTFSFLPAESSVIIPAQALSLYNGAIAAANFIDAGTMSVRQAVMVILIGSLVTAPVRTFKHALPTYVAVLGARPGLIMAISAQVLRSIFLIICIFGLWLIWM